MLTKNQFALLSYIAARPAGEPALSQRAIAQGTGKALGTVNGLVKELSAMGCLDGANRITDAGLRRSRRTGWTTLSLWRRA